MIPSLGSFYWHFFTLSDSGLHCSSLLMSRWRHSSFLLQCFRFVAYPFSSFIEFPFLCLYYPSVPGCWLLFPFFFNIRIIVILNSLFGNSKICVVAEFGSDSCFVSCSDCAFPCLSACLHLHWLHSLLPGHKPPGAPNDNLVYSLGPVSLEDSWSLPSYGRKTRKSHSAFQSFFRKLVSLICCFVYLNNSAYF